MMPYSEINTFDTFCNPMFRDGVLFIVEKKNDAEKMLLVQGYSQTNLSKVGPSFWKHHTDRLFSEHWRV